MKNNDRINFAMAQILRQITDYLLMQTKLSKFYFHV